MCGRLGPVHAADLVESMQWCVEELRAEASLRQPASLHAVVGKMALGRRRWEQSTFLAAVDFTILVQPTTAEVTFSHRGEVDMSGPGLLCPRSQEMRCCDVRKKMACPVNRECKGENPSTSEGNSQGEHL